MNARQFYDLVKNMRRKQLDYNANMAHGINDLRLLNEKKQLERQLDAEIQRVEAIINKPPQQQKLDL